MIGKRGFITPQPYFWMFDLLLVIIVLAAFTGMLYTKIDNTHFTQTYLARDIAFTINGILHTTGDITLTYDLGRDDLSVTISGKRVFIQKKYENKIQSTAGFPYIPIKGADIAYEQEGSVLHLTKTTKGTLTPTLQEDAS